ncbi:hypothetical protein [Streptomyces sp. NK15101]|uniref:hypothetical protein n=1 Tax=Streptomyces sp. NK15101 TaxID=2873261 RepID=UPI001CED5AC4|nr:hypothetical protein [Streptomyces sp. NK15101]
MRPLATRHLTALAISAALTLGTAGPAFAGEHHPSSTADRVAHAPLPDVTDLPAQAEALGGLGSVATPVTELVTAALEADSGRLSAADAEAFKAEIATAVDQAKATAPAFLPDAPAAPELPTAPVDVVSDTLGSVEKAVAALLSTLTSGVGGVVPQVTSTLSSLLNLVLGPVLGGLPAPDAATAPTLPATAPELPVKPPATVPELPVKPPLPVR